ncbi:membrane protein YdbS with pleckstrin-like domain [Streptomyces aurantiacus]|uniref:PH domain-containing protein n=1 Tax=Streptomyces aurantiacus TaxID=47760 RepID=UPI0027914A07|nr:PH domain-containing protein [Streptomyces aurantiacus]MDQ0776442.1 membrane protein YdbS with pleckstrin-like domain [Streptomyces aurantiacus]
METGTSHDAGQTAGQPAERATGPSEPTADEPVWIGLPPGLLRMRRLLLMVWLGLLAIGTGLLLGLLVGPGWAAFALVPSALLLGGWSMLGRNWRSWRYAERADDLLISRGVLWREETVVPYGRMQLVEVTSGPVERYFGLASVQLHTAAAATDACIPGLDPAEAERLRDRLTELGEARSAGL